MSATDRLTESGRPVFSLSEALLLAESGASEDFCFTDCYREEQDACNCD